jgi:hypothetical protein
MLDLRRRQFITLIGGAAAWPFAARGTDTSWAVTGPDKWRRTFSWATTYRFLNRGNSLEAARLDEYTVMLLGGMGNELSIESF